MDRNKVKSEGIYEIHYNSPTGRNDVVQAGLTGDRAIEVLDMLEIRGISKYDIVPIEGTE